MGRTHKDLSPFIEMLKADRYSVDELCAKLSCTRRTVYRLIDKLDWMDVGLEQGFDDKFFIVS
jgi:predicted transcriptional regulator